MRKLTTQEFTQKARAVHGRIYDYSKVVYTKSSVKVRIGCKTHGVFEQRPNDHLKGDGCPSCKFERIASLKRSTAKEFAKKARAVHGKVYDYSKVVYVNANTKVDIVCKTHGVFLQTPDKHLGGTACPKCSNGVSRGEKAIQKILDSKGIKYTIEKRFPGLCGTTPNSRLRYDFWLPDHNLLIEYDGEHHFAPVQTKGRLTKKQAIIRHEATKVNDRKKNQYAKKNNIRLTRIKFSDNIESSISSTLAPTQIPE
jgi:hypothetical protein